MPDWICSAVTSVTSRRGKLRCLRGRRWIDRTFCGPAPCRARLRCDRAGGEPGGVGSFRTQRRAVHFRLQLRDRGHPQARFCIRLLGFPRPSYYKWFRNPFIKVQRYSLERISISEDGQYAMVKIVLKGRERLNPAQVRGDIQFDMIRPHVDYWEKVDGKWVITVLVDKTSISGAMKTLYFIPNNNDAWVKKEYVHIDPASLLAEPDPERHALNGKH